MAEKISANRVLSAVEVLRNELLNTHPDYEQNKWAMGYLQALQDIEEKFE